MAEFDLTHVMGKYFDRHLLLPLLDFLAGKGVYPQDNIAESRLKVLTGTRMVRETQEAYKAVHGKESPGMSRKRCYQGR